MRMRFSDESSIKAEVVDIPGTTTEPTEQQNNPVAEETSKIQETLNESKKFYNLPPKSLGGFFGYPFVDLSACSSTSGAGKGGDSLASLPYLTTLITLNRTRYKKS